MIAHLDGVHETVDYRKDTSLRFYDNTDYEEYPVHWHTCVEIIMPVKGDYRLTINGTQTVLQPDDILIVCPGVLHHLYACSGERYILQAELTKLYSSSPLSSAISMIYPGIVITRQHCPDIYSRTHQLMTEIVSEYFSIPPMLFYDSAIYARMTEIFILAARSYSSVDTVSENETKQKEYIDTFTQICCYIDEHCSEDISLDDAAKMSGFSKYYFNRLFKRFTSKTYYRYLNQKRIEKAEQMLSSTEMSITDIGAQCGYSSMPSFIRMFKIMHGCTPTQFRDMRE